MKIKDKHIVIGVTGSIAAYKAAELASRLKKEEACLYTVMTESAKEFIGGVTFKSLTGNPVFSKMFPKQTEFASTVHIGLSEWLDILVIVPATANIIGKIAHGIADDLLSTVVLATDKPVLIAPAMNEKMYLNKVVQENISLLKERGYHIVEPETGFLACGYTGMGRLADINKIVDEIKKLILK